MSDRRFLKVAYVAVLAACTLVYLIGVGCPARAADAQGKAYSPFDEPKPKTPEEIIADKRLDQTVKVFCKSRNLKDLFADLSAKTGVKLTTARDVCDERVITFFHDRPLRDVMTEVSGLCGYRWMVLGKPGNYAYELYEDMRREDKRAGITAAIKEEQDDTLMDFTQKLTAGGPDADGLMDRLRLSNPEAYDHMTSPQGRNTLDMLKQLDTSLFVMALAGQPAGCTVGAMPPQAQDAIYRCMRDTLPNTTTDDMANTVVKVEQMMAGADGMPHFNLSLTVGKHGSMGFSWPSLSGDDMRKAVGRPVPQDISGDTSLPDKQKITADKLRWLPHAHGLLLGDLLEAIAIQSGKDIVADYYLDNQFVDAIKAKPLEEVVRMICRTFRYSCEVSGQTMRFRNNRWYAEDTMHEPPSSVMEHLWARVENGGQIRVRDLAEMASLNDDQFKWPGFRFMPGVDDVLDQPSVLRLWSALSPAQEEAGRSSDGLAVSDLSIQQVDRINAWIVAQKVDVSSENVEKAVVLITTPHPVVTDQGQGAVSMNWSSEDSARGAATYRVSRGAKDAYLEVSQSVFECLCIKYPSSRMVLSSIRLYKPLDEQERNEVIAQRKADAAAEVVEILQ